MISLIGIGYAKFHQPVVVPSSPTGAPTPVSGSPTPLGHPPREPFGAIVPGAGWRYGAWEPGVLVPVTWDPCRPIHYVEHGTPLPGGEALLRQALTELSTATGLHFVSDGTTPEVPSPYRGTGEIPLYGYRSPPVLIAWADARAMPRGAAPAIAFPRDSYLPLPTGGVLRLWVTGEVLFSTDDLRALVPGEVRAEMLRALATLVGLDVVDDPLGIMNTGGPGVTTYGPGDLAGLAELGRGPCAPDVGALLPPRTIAPMPVRATP
jgi:hypothetical protein